MGNSVIYRPAYDAEVEYLESTGTQYIDTGIVLENKLNSRFVIEYNALSSNISNIISGLAGNAFKGPSVGMNVKSGQPIFVYSLSTRTQETAIEGYYDTFYEYDLNGVDGYYKVTNTDNNEVVVNTPIVTGDYTQNTLSIILFAYRTITNDVTVVSKCKYQIKRCSIYDNNILVRDFIPVRIGSTGYMYDKVTKQLFASKGTGNFILGNDVSNAVIPQQRCVLYFGNQRSVIYERIYEEYEWLVGDGSAYIDTLVSDLTNVDFIRCHYSCTGTMVDNRIFGREGDARITCKANVNNVSKLSVWIDSAGFALNHNKEDDYIEIDLVNNIASTSLESNNFEPITNLVGTTLYLFGDHGYNVVFPYKIKKFEIDGKLTLIPCKLLQSIPAILDGNGIARQAGTCGMWDKVNGRFYGNVASSGSFTVSND